MIDEELFHQESNEAVGDGEGSDEVVGRGVETSFLSKNIQNICILGK